MTEWVETETRGRNSRWLLFFPPQTFGELRSNVTLFISLRIPDCQIASSQGFTMGSLSSSMFQQKAILHRCSHRSNQSTHLPSKLLKTLLKRKWYSWGLTEVRTFFPIKEKMKRIKRKHFKTYKKNLFIQHISLWDQQVQPFELKAPQPQHVEINVENVKSQVACQVWLNPHWCRSPLSSMVTRTDVAAAMVW